MYQVTAAAFFLLVVAISRVRGIYSPSPERVIGLLPLGFRTYTNYFCVLEKSIASTCLRCNAR